MYSSFFIQCALNQFLANILCHSVNVKLIILIRESTGYDIKSVVDLKLVEDNKLCVH